METLVKTEEYKGYEIEIHWHESSESPDDWGDEEVFLVYDHRDFCVERDGFDSHDIFEAYENGDKLYDGYYYFPVYAYIHSGIALSASRSGYPFSCSWDTSFKGFALVKRAKGVAWNKDKAFERVQGLLETWNQYLSGEVYGYVANKYGEMIDSCWGYYGDPNDYMIDEAKGMIDHHIQEKRKNHFEQVKSWIKNKVPLHHRKAFA